MTTDPKAIVPAAAQQPGTLARREFGGDQLAVQAETASSVLAAQAKAQVEARFVMALRNPRDWDDVSARVMKEVERPGFAEVAWYKKPIGSGVEGLSVRFTDAASRCMGNLMEEAPVIYEDAQKRIVRISLTDLESNLTKFKDIAIDKTVERTSLNDGRIAISQRKNSQNKTTYTVAATEDEMLQKVEAIASKARRNLVLQVLPGDIKDRATKRILEIRRGSAAKDPDAARRKVLEAFATLNVQPSELKKWLGHDVATASPAQLDELRDLHSAIREGETTWADALAEKAGGGAQAEGDKPEERKPGMAGLTERLQQQTCSHPDVPPSAVSALKAGQSIACKACGEELSNPDAPEPQLGRPPADTPAANPTTPQKKAGQQRLTE